MDQITICSAYGKYLIDLVDIEEKKLVRVYIYEIVNLEELLEEAKKIAFTYGGEQILFTKKGEEFAQYPKAYEVHQLILSQRVYKADKNFRILGVNLENRNDYCPIINEAYRRISNGRLFTSTDLLEGIKTEQIFYVTYQKTIIGAFQLKDNCITLYAIALNYQSKGLSMGGLKRIVTRMKNDVKIFVANDNERAYKMLIKSGFVFNEIAERWYKLSD